MALDYDFNIDGKLLQVTTKGFDAGVEEAVSYGEAIIKCCQDNQCRQVLMDETEMTAALSEVSQYQMVQRLLTQIPFGLDIAIVSNSINQEETSFGVMVAGNRGLHIQLFETTEAAREWLKEQAPQ